MLRSVLLVPLLVGCAREREPAPTEMEDIVRYLFRNWEDPEAVSEATGNLAGWLDEFADSEDGRKGLRLTRLEPDDLLDVTWPEERGLDAVLGVCGAAVSRHPVELHAETQLLEDQAYLNPINYESYLREFVGGDRAAFGTGAGLARSVNDIHTKSWGIKIPYELQKDFRWVEAPDVGPTFISRAWVEEPSCSDNGNNCVQLSFAIEIWMGRGDETLRMTAGWSEVTSSLQIGDDLLIAGLAGGFQTIFEKTDDYLDEYSR